MNNLVGCQESFLNSFNSPLPIHRLRKIDNSFLHEHVWIVGVRLRVQEYYGRVFVNATMLSKIF
jgi:hypothetical protein